MECGVIYTIMQTISNSTEDSLFELGFIFCGKTKEFKVLEDCDYEIFEKVTGIASQLDVPVRVIKPEPVCRVCNEPLVCNGTRNTKYEQKYFS